MEDFNTFSTKYYKKYKPKGVYPEILKLTTEEYGKYKHYKHLFDSVDSYLNGSVKHIAKVRGVWSYVTSEYYKTCKKEKFTVVLKGDSTLCTEDLLKLVIGSNIKLNTIKEVVEVVHE